MEIKSESVFRRMLKIVFTFIAVFSLLYVGYNIGIYTNEQDIEVFADIR